jgi:hypothetical protein
MVGFLLTGIHSLVCLFNLSWFNVSWFTRGRAYPRFQWSLPKHRGIDDSPLGHQD